jgi:hypothetical protein
MKGNIEKYFKGANAMKDIRSVIDKYGEMQLEDARQKLMDGPRNDLENRLSKVQYCDEQVKIIPPATNDEIELAWKGVQTMFPGLHKNKTKKTDLSKIKPYHTFMEKHTRVSRYNLELFKCDDSECEHCLEVRMPRGIWEIIVNRPRILPLPAPMQTDSNGKVLKYKTYDEVKNTSTSMKHLPSLKYKSSEKQAKEAKDYDTHIQKQAL